MKTMSLNTCLLLNQKAIMQTMMDLLDVLERSDKLGELLKSDRSRLYTRLRETSLRISVEERR